MKPIGHEKVHERNECKASVKGVLQKDICCIREEICERPSRPVRAGRSYSERA